jgi:nucleotide-binding universal stress UspA family protein
MCGPLARKVPTMTDLSAGSWTREATRLHSRYLLEVVEACGFCPWALKARLTDRVRVAVLLEADDTLVEQSLVVIDSWVADEDVEVGFLIYPRLPLPRVEFDRFAARVRSADTGRYGLGEAPFAAAAFHPHAEPDVHHPERLVPFLRRTPDPCIQIVRTASLARVRGRAPDGTTFVDLAHFDPRLSEDVGPPLRERIARANFETVQRLGLDEVRGRLDAIRRDRDATYGALLAGDFGAPEPRDVPGRFPLADMQEGEEAKGDFQTTAQPGVVDFPTSRGLRVPGGVPTKEGMPTSAPSKTFTVSKLSVVVGLDFTDADGPAFDDAARIVQRVPGSELHLVHVFDAPPSVEQSRDLAEHLRLYVDEKAAIATGLQGISVGVHLRAGKPVREILQLATEVGANLIVVGSHKGPHLKDWIVGSTGERLMKAGPFPVLVASLKPKEPEQVEPAIEPACPQCLQARAATGGKQWWCERHMHEANQAHTYSYQRELPFATHDSAISPTGVD